MNLVRELEKDLKIANVICMVSIYMECLLHEMNVTFSCAFCDYLKLLWLRPWWMWLLLQFFLWYLQNGRRHLTSSLNEVSRDLIVNSNSKKKQALLVFLALYTLATLIFIDYFIFLIFALEDHWILHIIWDDYGDLFQNSGHLPVSVFC